LLREQAPVIWWADGTLSTAARLAGFETMEA
jgi:hypothetical protein